MAGEVEDRFKLLELSVWSRERLLLKRRTASRRMSTTGRDDAERCTADRGVAIFNRRTGQKVSLLQRLSQEGRSIGTCMSSAQLAVRPRHARLKSLIVLACCREIPPLSTCPQPSSSVEACGARSRPFHLSRHNRHIFVISRAASMVERGIRRDTYGQGKLHR